MLEERERERRENNQTLSEDQTRFQDRNSIQHILSRITARTCRDTSNPAVWLLQSIRTNITHWDKIKVRLGIDSVIPFDSVIQINSLGVCLGESHIFLPTFFLSLFFQFCLFVCLFAFFRNRNFIFLFFSFSSDLLLFCCVFPSFLCRCGSDCYELERGRNMKLGPITGNDVQVHPKKHDPSQPDGGAVIKAPMYNFGKATLHMQTDLKFDAQGQLSVPYKL